MNTVWPGTIIAPENGVTTIGGLVTILNALDGSFHPDRIQLVSIKNKTNGQRIHLIIGKVGVYDGGCITFGYPYPSAFRVYKLEDGTWADGGAI